MPKVTFQVIDGVDKGVIFPELTTPITLGREEGNTVRLNDERISRFHAKIQFDQGDVILTDLESTNGTRVNGQIIHVHRLRHGDCVHIGRSVLLYGSLDDIAARETQMSQITGHRSKSSGEFGDIEDVATVVSNKLKEEDSQFPQFTIAENATVTSSGEGLRIGRYKFPPLPQKLTPSQAARLSEMLGFLHNSLSSLLPCAQINEDGTEVRFDFSTWQKFLQTELLLARYCQAITDPEQ